MTLWRAYKIKLEHFVSESDSCPNKLHKYEKYFEIKTSEEIDPPFVGNLCI
jgi:hypothetical protein